MSLLAIAANAYATGSVSVAWDASPEPDITSYVVLYGRTPGTYTQRITVPSSTTTARLDGLAEGERYYIAVAAVNAEGLQSDPSNEVNELIPYSASTSTLPDAARMVVGLDRMPARGGWLEVRAGTALSLATRVWTQLDFAAYTKGG